MFFSYFDHLNIGPSKMKHRMKVPVIFFGVLWFSLMAYLQLNIYSSAQVLCFYTIYWASYPNPEDVSPESQYLVP